MPYNYYDNCEAELPEHLIDPCNAEREFGRVRSGGFIAEDYLASILANPTDITVWKAGIDAGKITFIPKTAGSFDPGDPSALQGYGDTENSNGPRTQTLTLIDPNYKLNYAFWNAFSDITNRVPFYRTSSMMHIADVTASVVAKDTVDNDLTSEVVWTATIKWSSRNLPQIHEAVTLAPLFKTAA